MSAVSRVIDRYKLLQRRETQHGHASRGSGRLVASGADNITVKSPAGDFWWNPPLSR